MPDTPHNKPDRRPSEAVSWFLFDRDRLLRHNTDMDGTSAGCGTARRSRRSNGDYRTGRPDDSRRPGTRFQYTNQVLCLVGRGSAGSPSRREWSHRGPHDRSANGVRLPEKPSNWYTVNATAAARPRYGDEPTRDFEALSDLRKELFPPSPVIIVLICRIDPAGRYLLFPVTFSWDFVADPETGE